MESGIFEVQEHNKEQKDSDFTDYIRAADTTTALQQLYSIT